MINTDDLEQLYALLYDLSDHVCDCYCTDHHLCREWWQMVDDGKAIAFAGYEQTYIIHNDNLLRPAWNHYAALIEELEE